MLLFTSYFIIPMMLTMMWVCSLWLSVSVRIAQSDVRLLLWQVPALPTSLAQTRQDIKLVEMKEQISRKTKYHRNSDNRFFATEVANVLSLAHLYPSQFNSHILIFVLLPGVDLVDAVLLLVQCCPVLLLHLQLLLVHCHPWYPLIRPTTCI